MNNAEIVDSLDVNEIYGGMYGCDGANITNSPSSITTSSGARSYIYSYGTKPLSSQNTWHGYQKLFDISANRIYYRTHFYGRTQYEAWQQIALNSDLANNTISTSGLICPWGTIEDGGYTQIGKMVVVNIRMKVISALTIGTKYHISGLPQIKNNHGGNVGSFSSNWSEKLTNMYIGFDELNFIPSENISANEVMLFSATYVTP